jgi:hypothetical protein
MADVVKKAVAGQPIKMGGAVAMSGGGIAKNSDRSTVLPDTWIDDETARLGPLFRNRLYYTTGAADPADPV